MSILQKAVDFVAKRIPRFLPSYKYESDYGHDYPIVSGPETILKIPWVYASVRLIADTVASVNLRVYPAKAMNNLMPYQTPPNPIEDSPLAQVLNRPNPYMGRKELLKATQMWLEIFGNCYWILDRFNIKGQPERIWIVDPRNVRIVPDEKRYVVGYIYSVDGSWDPKSQIPFDPHEVIHFKENSFLLDPYYGLGTVQMIGATLELEQMRQEYDRSFFKRGARLNGVLEVPKTISQKVFERLKAEFNQLYGGAKNAHKIAILEQGTQYKPINATHVEMEKLAGDKFSRDKILAAFGIPPAKLGIMENANFSNSEEQNRTYLKETILPRLKLIEETINNHLANRYEGQVVLFDNIIPVDEDGLAKRASLLSTAGLLTVNELRGLLGFPPVDGGDELARPPGSPIGGSAPPTPGAPRPAAPAAPAAPSAPAAPAAAGVRSLQTKEAGPVLPEGESLEMLMARRQLFLDSILEEFLPDFHRFFDEQADRVLARIPEAGKMGKAYTFEPDDLFDMEEENQALASLLLLLILAAGKGGYRAGRELLGDPAELNLENDEHMAIINRLKEKAKTINQHTRDELKKLIAEGMRRGYSIRQIVYGFERENYPGILGLFEKFKGTRSENIIHDISVDAYNLFTLQAYKESGVQKVFVRDGVNYDAACREANNSIWTIERAMREPKEHIRCRRSFWPIPRKEGQDANERVADRRSVPEVERE